MDRKRVLLNILTGIITKVIILFITIVLKRFLILDIGPSANGLLSLFASIISIITIIELGLGSAITYSLYKPIVAGDRNQISALFYKYRKYYKIIGILTLLVGIFIMPFLDFLIKDTPYKLIELISFFTIFLLANTIKYFYSYKIALINAYKDNYITTLIGSIILILQISIQIAIIILTKSFLYFLVIKVIMTLLEAIIVNYKFRKTYFPKLNNNKIVSQKYKTEITRNIKAMFIMKLGTILVNGLDSIFISSKLGLIDLSSYSNYITIAVGITSIMSLVFIQIHSIIAHENIKVSTKKYYNYFINTYVINFIIALVIFVFYYAVIDNLITILFGASFILDKTTVLLLTLVQFTAFMGKTSALFSSASGLYYQNRFRALIQGVIKVVLALLLIDSLEIKGLLIATLISRLLVRYIFTTYNLFKYRFNKSPYKFYVFDYLSVVIFFGCLIIFNFLKIKAFKNIYYDLLYNSVIAILIIATLLTTFYILIKRFRETVNKSIYFLKRS